MEKREMAQGVEKHPYFEASAIVEQSEPGTRDMGELYPFLISGGQNTERFYFTHINDTTGYKFNIKPKYFCDESNYTEAFPKRIREVLRNNNDAKIYCVFDWDTIYGDESKKKKHAQFEEQFKEEIAKGILTICPSMPSIEYWFLLHFVNDKTLRLTCGKVIEVLAPYMNAYFPHKTKTLGKVIKAEKYLKDSSWVENLCADGKLELAIARAEKNIEAALAAGNLESQSYSFVYKVFKRQ